MQTTESEEMPDAAALSNIFSLGTPRQLSALELARRNDLLAQLEREAARAQRRASTTLIASMSLGGPSVGRDSDEAMRPSQADHQHFQAYVAANSVVTMGSHPTDIRALCLPHDHSRTTKRVQHNIEDGRILYAASSSWSATLCRLQSLTATLTRGRSRSDFQRRCALPSSDPERLS